MSDEPRAWPRSPGWEAILAVADQWREVAEKHGMGGRLGPVDTFPPDKQFRDWTWRIGDWCQVECREIDPAPLFEVMAELACPDDPRWPGSGQHNVDVWQECLRLFTRLRYQGMVDRPGPPERDESETTPDAGGGDSETISDTRTGKGATLRDAAEILTDGEPELTRQKTREWNNLRSPKKPAVIGKCPNHSQRKLSAPSAIFAWVKKVEGSDVCEECRLLQGLTARARPPRPE